MLITYQNLSVLSIPVCILSPTLNFFLKLEIFKAILVLLDIPDRRVIHNPHPRTHSSLTLLKQYCCSSAVTGAVLNRMLQRWWRTIAVGDGDARHSWNWNFNYSNKMRQGMTRGREHVMEMEDAGGKNEGVNLNQWRQQEKEY